MIEFRARRVGKKWSHWASEPKFECLLPDNVNQVRLLYSNLFQIEIRRISVVKLGGE